MARPVRIQFEGATYHVMNRGTSRLPIFISMDDKLLFLNVLADAVKLWRLKVHAYSLMENHYHLLIETPLGNLSRAMRHIDGVYTQRFNRHMKRDGALFRGRFKSILVQKETYFLALIRYIHMNAVKASLCSRADEHPFCSHPAYLNRVARPLWLTTRDALSRFGGDTHEGRTRMDAFVHAAVGDALHQQLDRTRWPAVIGGKKFIDAARRTLPTQPFLHPEKPQERDIRIKNTPEQVLRAVEGMYRLPPNALLGPAKRRMSQARIAAMHLLRKECLLSYAQIGAYLGGAGYSSIATTMRRKPWNEQEHARLVAKLLEIDCHKSQT